VLCLGADSLDCLSFLGDVLAMAGQLCVLDWEIHFFWTGRPLHFFTA
jgi:hypothetical protein